MRNGAAPDKPFDSLADLEALLRDAEAMLLPSGVRARLQGQIGSARLASGDRTGAIASLERMAALAGEAGDETLLREAQDLLASAQQTRSETPLSPSGMLMVLDYFPGAASLTELGRIFGRDRELNELIQRLTRTEVRFLTLWGMTGCGKSSLVRAGLEPRLHELNYLTARVSDWSDPESNCIAALSAASEAPIAEFTCNGHPTAAEETSVSGHMGNGSTQSPEPSSMREAIRRAQQRPVRQQ